MKQNLNLNDMRGRIEAAKRGEWQKSLADRWRYYLLLLDDHKETDDAPCPICSNAP